MARRVLDLHNLIYIFIYEKIKILFYYINMLRTGIDITADTTGNVVGDLSRAVLGSLTGVAKGLEDVILNIGNSADSLGKSVAVVSESIAEGVGDVTVTVADGLGKIIKEIPVVGRPSAFLVKGTGQGVYYVVLSLSDIVGYVGKTVGKTVKTTGKVIVFTLTSGTDISTSTINDANKIVKNVLDRVKNLYVVDGKKTKKSRGKKNNGKKKLSKKASKVKN